jgi:23S rRNA pseudouridine2605 synthase
MNRPNKKHSLSFFSEEGRGKKKPADKKSAPSKESSKGGKSSTRAFSSRDAADSGGFSPRKSFRNSSSEKSTFRNEGHSSDRFGAKRFPGKEASDDKPYRGKTPSRGNRFEDKPNASEKPSGYVRKSTSRFTDEDSGKNTATRSGRYEDKPNAPRKTSGYAGNRTSRFTDDESGKSRPARSDRFGDQGGAAKNTGGNEKRRSSRFSEDTAGPTRRSYSNDRKVGEERSNSSAKKTGKPGFKRETSYGEKSDYRQSEKTPGTFRRRTGSSRNDEKPRTYRSERKSPYASAPRGYAAKRSTPAADLAQGKDSDEIRLNKYISNSGICSRREADKLIESGAVTVNGIIITSLGHKIKSHDIVHIGGDLVRNEKKVYVLLNKPKDYITTSSDPGNRRTVMQLVSDACRERIYPVGRLDRNTTGLLLFTNDGELTKKLTHPRYGIEKIYHVELDKPFGRNDLSAIRKGLELEDGRVQVDEADFVEGATSRREVGVKLHSGKNRVVRRMFEHLGYHVVKLDRVVFAGLTKKDLPRGKWRFLSGVEVSALFAQT